MCIFDLVITAGQFGQTGENLTGDINADGLVNIFDLVLVAGSFGRSVIATAPSMVANTRLSTAQKNQIAAVINQLELNFNRSNEEEIVFKVLKAILVDRLPARTQLLANYPNPFNPETWIPFNLSEQAKVTINIYDKIGHPIRRLSLGHITAGVYKDKTKAAYWDGKNDDGEQIASGVYFYQIQAGDYRETRKMVILK